MIRICQYTKENRGVWFMGKKRSIVSSYIRMSQIFFGIAVFLVFAFLIIGEIVLPSEQDVLHTDFQIYDGEWSRVMENGEEIPVEFPGKVAAEYGEVVTLVTTLPDDIYKGKEICFRTVWQDINIYIAGELRKSYNTVNSRPFGINSAFRYVFVDLQEKDAGKELIYQFSSKSKYAGRTFACYIGDEAGIWGYLIRESGMRTVIAVFLLLMSLFCIIVCFILKIAYKKRLELNYLAWAIFLCAGWMLSEIEFRQTILKNVSVMTNFTYWSLMLIPIPLIIYINEIQKGRYQKLFVGPIIYTMSIFIIGTILQVFDIMQFVQQLPYVHTGLLTSILCIIITISIDTFKKRISEYVFVGIGIYGMLVTAVIELLLYYVGADVSLGTVLALGLVFLLIMAIIKTGQDFLRSEQKKQQAIAAREAQAKFLANMSHEIRTPINAIIGMNEMILRESKSEAVQGYAHNIHSASNMLLGLINDVLDFTKIESGQLELVEEHYCLAKLLQDEMVLLNARAAGKPISTQLEFDKDIPAKLYGDELRIKQVLTNLLSNAVKYTKEGSVTLKVFFKWLDGDRIELCFSVKDTGIGIKDEDLSKLFNSFKRLELSKNRNIEGTGLGLNITKQLVELMHGTITVESEYGRGSTFTVSIPQQVMDKHSIGRLEEALDACRKEKDVSTDCFVAPQAKVLVVDDNSMNLSLMKELLKRTQIQVDLAESGKECLKLAKTKKYHIILMDHMMPELDGVETLQILRSDGTNPNHDAVVVALTANATAGSREKYLEYGFHDYFSKPIQSDKLDELLIRYLPKELVQGKKRTEDSACGMKQEDRKIKDTTQEFLVIDREMGVSYCLDSEKLYQQILQSFCKQARTYLAQLDTHFQNHDWKSYAIIAHGLKGNALNIGAVNFSKLSLQHEQAAKSEDEAFIMAGYEDYITTLKDLMEEVEKMLG